MVTPSGSSHFYRSDISSRSVVVPHAFIKLGQKYKKKRDAPPKTHVDILTLEGDDGVKGGACERGGAQEGEARINRDQFPPTGNPRELSPPHPPPSP